MQRLDIQCECGAVQGFADVARTPIKQAACYCDDCQAYAHYLQKPEKILNRWGGTDIFPVTPAEFHITQGLDKLKSMRLSEKGMYRWFAGCCSTPIANQPANFNLPFNGTFRNCWAGPKEEIEKIVGKPGQGMMGKFAPVEPPAGTAKSISPSMMFQVIAFLTRAFVLRKAKPSPFLRDGQPISLPQVLSPHERVALRARTRASVTSPES